MGPRETFSYKRTIETFAIACEHLSNWSARIKRRKKWEKREKARLTRSGNVGNEKKESETRKRRVQVDIGCSQKPTQAN